MRTKGGSKKLSYKRLAHIDNLLEVYYNSEDSFEQTDLAISLIQSNMDWLINQAKTLEWVKQVISLCNEEDLAPKELARMLEKNQC
jgi:hypothetical protein